MSNLQIFLGVAALAVVVAALVFRVKMRLNAVERQVAAENIEIRRRRHHAERERE